MAVGSHLVAVVAEYVVLRHSSRMLQHPHATTRLFLVLYAHFSIDARLKVDILLQVCPIAEQRHTDAPQGHVYQ